MIPALVCVLCAARLVHGLHSGKVLAFPFISSCSSIAAFPGEGSWTEMGTHLLGAANFPVRHSDRHSKIEERASTRLKMYSAASLCDSVSC